MNLKSEQKSPSKLTRFHFRSPRGIDIESMYWLRRAENVSAAHSWSIALPRLERQGSAPPRQNVRGHCDAWRRAYTAYTLSPLALALCLPPPLCRLSHNGRT